ncbi:HTH_Tnp_Tc3_2 domain-containing protein [Trichonephila clavipes]|nr:HTH_Tnp_Tc3_2 domain-containing protein [Trichonephila clavipes]
MDSSRFPHHDGSGRPMATSDREDRLTARSAVTMLASSLSTIRRATRTLMSTMAIHRRQIERNVCSYRSLRSLPLTPEDCRARLQWC